MLVQKTKSSVPSRFEFDVKRLFSPIDRHWSYYAKLKEAQQLAYEQNKGKMSSEEKLHALYNFSLDDNFSGLSR